jgi:outer membrane lipoprotein SlyB
MRGGGFLFRYLRVLGALGLCVCLLQGCSSGNTGNFNSGTEPYTARAVRFGTIVNVGEGSISGSWGTVDHKAVELTIEMDGGEMLSVVQQNDNYFAINDRVRVIFNADGTARVVQ